jgi:hypothetical protein
MAFKTGLDPDIPLGVKPEVAAPQNPLQTVGAFAQIQNALNQNRLFQQTFAAKKAMGLMAATTPRLSDGSMNWDALVTRLGSSPYAPFAGEFVNQIRNMQNTQMEIAAKKQAVETSGFNGGLKIAASAALNGDLAAFEKQKNAYLKTQPKEFRDQIGDALDAWWEGTQGATPQETAYNRSSAMIAAGLTPEGLGNIVGTPSTRATATGIESGVTLPAALGGGFVAHSFTPKGIAPALVPGAGPGGSIGVFPGAGGGSGAMPGGASGSGGNPLAPQAGSQTQGALPGLGLTVKQKASAEGLGKVAGDIQTDLANDAKALPRALQQATMMSDALTQFQSGGGAEFRQRVGKMAQAIGAPQSIVDGIANGSLSQTQIFSKVVRPFVIDQLKQSAQGTGRVMASEVESFMKMLDNTTDPRAAEEIINRYKQRLQIGYDQTQKWPEFKTLQAEGTPSTKGMDLGDFYAWYNKNYLPGGLPESTKGGKLSFAPTKTAKGTSSYANADAVKRAFKSGKITRSQAINALKQFGYQ